MTPKIIAPAPIIPTIYAKASEPEQAMLQESANSKDIKNPAAMIARMINKVFSVLVAPLYFFLISLNFF